MLLTVDVKPLSDGIKVRNDIPLVTDVPTGGLTLLSSKHFFIIHVPAKPIYYLS
jgi:hypothetical protein